MDSTLYYEIIRLLVFFHFINVRINCRFTFQKIIKYYKKRQQEKEIFI